MLSRVRAYLCAPKEGFPKLPKNCQVLCKTVGGGVFSVFSPKINNANPIWQTIGDAQYKGESQVIITGW
jgi:hypothetical protein